MELVPYRKRHKRDDLYLPGKDTVRRCLSANKEEDSYQKLNLPVTWSQHLELWEVKGCCLIHAVYNIFVIADQTD